MFLQIIHVVPEVKQETFEDEDKDADKENKDKCHENKDKNSNGKFLKLDIDSFCLLYSLYRLTCYVQS